MQEAITFRPRSGATATIASAGNTSSVAIPAGTRQVIVTCTGQGGRVLVSNSGTAPTPNATNYGYMGANIPMTIKPGGYDTHIHLSSTTASNTFYLTFGV